MAIRKTDVVNENVDVETATIGGEVALHAANEELSRQLASIDANSASTSIVSTIQGDDFDTRLRTVDAVMNAEQLQDHLKEPFALANWVGQTVKLVNEDGAEVNAIRCILITDDGKAYATVSEGVISALSNLVTVLGHPSTWASPVTVFADRVQGRNGFHFLTLKLGRAAK